MKYTDQQREAIESRARSVCVEASAGSGKTRVLVDRIVDLIASDDADLDEIVAITFTEKAASEMKARLRNAFRQRAPEDDPEAMSQWRDNERRVDSARITTIHAFCAAILRESALWIGLDPDFAVMTGPQAQLLTDQIVDETLHDLLEDKDASLTRLATHIPLREISQLLKSTLGKRTLLERVREQFSLDDAESLKTRWQKAAELERGRRIDAAQHDATLRAYRARLAQAEGDCDTADEPREALRRTMINSLNELFALEEGEASARRTRTEGILSELSAPNVRGKPKLWANRSTYKAVSDDQKEIRELAQKYLAIPNPIPAIEEAAAQHVLDFDTTFRCVRDAYQASKRAANALDYEDLIEALLVVLRKRTDFRQRIAGGIKHLLVDEFQDTDGTQLELVRLLVDEVGGPNLFIVGDAKQSIYLFRGAEVEVFQAEKSQAEHTILLEKNFRTVPEILHFSNDFFAVSGVLSAVETYVPMQPHRDSTGQPRIEFLLSSSGPDAAKKQSTEDYRRTEAKNIVARICDLCHGESPLQIKDEHSGVIHDACYGDIAILFQAMTEAHLYEEALRKAHIPYVLSSGATFYRQQEIIDVMNLLKLLVDPYDEYALLAFLRGPMGCLCDDEVFRLAQQGNLCTAFWSVSAETESDSPDSLRGARALIELLRERAELPVSELLRFMLAHTGYEAILHAQFRGVQKAANVPKLVRLAEEFGRGQHASLRAYVYYLEAMRAQSVRETDATTQSDDLSAVTLMSIHKSKGLEFPVVFIGDMQRKNAGSHKERLFLHRALGMTLKATDDFGGLVSPIIGEAISGRLDAEEEAEFGRKLYVAMTRARDYLVLCGVPYPQRKSWFETFDTYYGISGKQEGDVISGANWKGIVRHNPTAKLPSEVKQDIQAVPEAREALLTRISPLDLDAPTRKSFAISEVLNHFPAPSETATISHAKPSARPPSPNQFYAMERGTLVHRMFELWDFANDIRPPVADIVRGSGCSLHQRNSLAEDLEKIANEFRDTHLFERLVADKGLAREAPFSLNLGESLIAGTIDVLLSDGTLVDYKTGAYNAKQDARYKWQLLLYAIAVEKLRGITPKVGLLYYVDAGKVKEHPLSSEEMSGALQRAREVIATAQSGPLS